MSQAASDRNIQSLKIEGAKRGHLVGSLENHNNVPHSTSQRLFDLLVNEEGAPVVRHAPSSRTLATAKMTCVLQNIIAPSGGRVLAGISYLRI